MIIKKILTILVLVSAVMVSISGLTYAETAPSTLPDPNRDFFKKISDASHSGDGVAVYDPASFGISNTNSLKNNIKNMFYPSPDSLNKIWPVLQTVAGIIFFIFIVVIGGTFLLDADEESKITNVKNSFIYLMYGGFLVFGSMWLLKQIDIGGGGQGAGLVLAIKDKIIFNFISFIKASAFFVAIILIIYHGLQIIRAYEKEDKLTEARKAVINILGVLILIKVVDYVYFIAYDNGFKTKAVDLIVEVSKLFGRGIGILSILYLIYAGVMLVTGQGESDKFKKATNIIKGIFFAALIIFLFLLTMYQLFKDLG